MQHALTIKPFAPFRVLLVLLLGSPDFMDEPARWRTAGHARHRCQRLLRAVHDILVFFCVYVRHTKFDRQLVERECDPVHLQ